MLKYISAIALGVIILGSSGAYACNPPSPSQVGLNNHCLAVPTVLVHLTYLPKQIELKVGNTVVFAADGPRYGSNASVPSVKLNSPGSMGELDAQWFAKGTLRNRGDEERLWNAFQATQLGTFTLTVTYSAEPGIAPRTEQVTIKVVP